MNENLEYFLLAALDCTKSSRRICPACGGSSSKVVDSKYMVTKLRRCESCSMLYRTPTTSDGENRVFYQKKYKMGFTSELPDDQELARLLQTKFKDTIKNYDPYIEILRALCPAKAKILDFGCSWGYGTWQIRDAGFDVSGYEISRPRCEFAQRKLGLDASFDVKEIEPDSFDVFFSSHVLEHVPSVLEALRLAKRLLKKDGLFISLTPNGSNDFKKAHYQRWQKLWGRVHPNLLDDIFFASNTKNVFLDSPPYDLIALKNSLDAGASGVTKIKPLDAGELLSVIRAADLPS